MSIRLSGGASLVLLALVMGLALPVRAAPSRQAQIKPPQILESETPSPTPSPTRTPEGRIPPGGSPEPPLTPPSGPPTPTLLPPPDSGGRVMVDALYVRKEPDFDADVLGLIAYNQSIYPIGRNANNTWIAIKWSNETGWVYASFVAWDPKFDLNSLPVLAPANLTPLPTEVPTGITGTPETSTPEATATPEPSKTATATVTPRPTPSSTAVMPSPAPTKAAAIAPPSNSGSSGVLESLPPGAKTGGLMAGGVLLLVGGVYLWRRISSYSEIKRYQGGFPLTLCPVCLEGHVQLDQVAKTSLGIVRLTRSVRCNNCHSVLREIRPGVWRYSVDSYVNPEMAERYRTHRLKESDLKQLAEYATEARFKLEVEKEETLKSQLDLSWLDVSYDESPTDSEESARSAPDNSTQEELDEPEQ